MAAAIALQNGQKIGLCLHGGDSFHGLIFAEQRFSVEAMILNNAWRGGLGAAGRTGAGGGLICKSTAGAVGHLEGYQFFFFHSNSLYAILFSSSVSILVCHFGTFSINETPLPLIVLHITHNGFLAGLYLKASVILSILCPSSTSIMLIPKLFIMLCKFSNDRIFSVKSSDCILFLSMIMYKLFRL